MANNFEWPKHFIRQRDEWAEEMFDDAFGRAKAATDSPIEAMFLSALLMHGFLSSDSVFLVQDKKYFGISTRPGIDVMPQAQIEGYRVDFLVRAVNHGMVETIVVECDGHNFHERTKKQAQKDKSRDRELQSMGYKVYRYTGSEIYADAFNLVGQLLADIDMSLYLRARHAQEDREG